MDDTAIAVGAAFLTFVIGIMGAYVTFNPPDTKKEKIWWLAAFLLCAIAGTALVGWQTVRNGKQQDALNTSIGYVRQDLQKSETGREVDNAYLKAKLEDYSELQKLAPALLEMAQATEGYTKKEYEVKTMSDARLLSFTDDVIARIRTLGGNCKAQSDSLWETMAASHEDQTRSMNMDQRGKYEEDQERIREQKEWQLRDSCSQTYRQQIMGDASYARNELLKRLGGDSFLGPMLQSGHIAIDGIFAGADPIDDSANYLDALAHKLAEQMPKQQ